MIVTCTAIVAKIKDLPEHYAEHVHMSKPGPDMTAQVDSFTDPKAVYTVAIHRTKNDGERNVVCTCEATKLCNHVTAFYAVAKGIKRDGSVESTSTSPPKPDKGKQTPSKEIDKSFMPLLISMEKALVKVGEVARKGREAAIETMKALDELDAAYLAAKKEIEK